MSNQVSTNSSTQNSTNTGGTVSNDPSIVNTLQKATEDLNKLLTNFTGLTQEQLQSFTPEQLKSIRDQLTNASKELTALTQIVYNRSNQTQGANTNIPITAENINKSDRYSNLIFIFVFC